MSVCMVCDGVSGAGGGGGGVRMRGRLWGQVVRVPPGGSTEGALPSRCPARHRVGPSSVAVLPMAERGTAHRGGSDGVSCARGGGLQASSGLSDRLVGDTAYGLELGGCALPPSPRGGKPLTRKPLGFDGGCGRYGGGGAAQCGVVVRVESAMGDAEGVNIAGPAAAVAKITVSAAGVAGM